MIGIKNTTDSCDSLVVECVRGGGSRASYLTISQKYSMTVYSLTLPADPFTQLHTRTKADRDPILRHVITNKKHSQSLSAIPHLHPLQPLRPNQLRSPNLLLCVWI